MITFRKKPKLYSAKWADSLRLRKKRRVGIYLTIEPILFYMLVAAVTEVSAKVLLLENQLIVIHILAVLLGLFLPAFITFSSWSKKHEINEHIYIEHMTYLFCKYKDFKKALYEIRDVFPKKEESHVINMALFILQESGKVENAIRYIELHFQGRRTRLLHRYILESRKRINYNPPAEILTGIITSPAINGRTNSARRKDRWTIFLCALISMSICMIIEVMGKESGFLSASYESSLPKVFSFVVFAAVFITYELKEFIQTINFEKYKLMKVSAYLKELTFFLLVMPVPRAIAKSVEFSEWSMKKKVSKLALAVEKNNSAEAYLAFSDKFHDESIKRIMEFLYAKSSEPYLAPAELTAMLRHIDEIMAKEVSRALFIESRERTSLLLAPQLATFVMLFGNVLSLVESVGRMV